ncbi:MAG TPA: hypothetical protein VFV78_11740 [Vicinamibacterales bacterium]|nr:hypothetical protein [Vicinamibacterales bacterium]
MPKPRSRLAAWFLADHHEGKASRAKVHTAPWWRVMCLTGVDYFSTLGYQPTIAFLAAGFLAPIATLVLVLLTLFGALPVYRRIAALSPYGQGSLSVIEERLPGWRGKAFVLCLLGFAATSFVITITLSAADASAHIIENPLVAPWLNLPVPMTLLLVAALGAVFLRGFKEAIWLAVILVGLYLAVNVVVIGWELTELFRHPTAFSDWRRQLSASHGSNPAMLAAAALIVFPKLALGLSGFETGVAVMPLVSGSGATDAEILQSRIVNTRKLLSTAALIMSVLLIGSSLVTTLRIPEAEMFKGGSANGRALAFLAHRDLGHVFGSFYDLATIGTLWFAGASAMAGLLNLVPQYLPRYGMAPDWARATRPLALVITGICAIVTILFSADVETQGGAYATGVLSLMTSAALAAAIALPKVRWFYIPVSVVFIYTTGVTVWSEPNGIKIAAWFVAVIVVSSFVSRVMRATEIRIDDIRYDETAGRFVNEAVERHSVRIIASRPKTGLPAEYGRKLADAQRSHHLPDDIVLFLEIKPGDASEFRGSLDVKGVDVGGYRVLRSSSPAIPNAIAGVLLDLRDRTGTIPHAYFGWTEGNPVTYLLKFLAFGEGDTAPVCREVLRKAEPNQERRPRVHVG